MNRVLCTSVIAFFGLYQTFAQTDPSVEKGGRVVHNSDRLTTTVWTEGRRPLLEAIQLVNQEYGWTVNYEEAPTVNASEIVDDDSAFRMSHPGYSDGYFPNAHGFPFTFDDSADKESVLNGLVSKYNNSSNPGKYALQRTAQGDYVLVGISYKSQQGSNSNFESPLNCKISLSLPAMGVRDALQRVVLQIKNTCHTSLDGEYAGEGPNISPAEPVSGNFDNESARDVLADLLSQGRYLMWYSVEYVPVSNKFYLETWLGLKTIVGINGNRVRDRIQNPKRQKANEKQ
jgi:hypothetical protein